MPRQFRSQIETVQTLPRHLFRTYTTTTGSAEDAATLAGTLEEAVKVSIVVDLYDAYVEFDGTATTSGLLIPAGEGYSDQNISILTRISILRATANNPRIRIALWGF